MLELEHCTLTENPLRGLTLFQWCCNFNTPTWLEYAKSRGLCGNVGYVCAWFAWVRWVRGLRGSNFSFLGSLRGLKFFTWVKNFCVGQLFFALVNFYLLDEIILLYYN